MLAFFQCAKMQISCLLILLFLSHNLFCEEKQLGKITIYHILHHVAVVAVLFFFWFSAGKSRRKNGLP